MTSRVGMDDQTEVAHVLRSKNVLWFPLTISVRFVYWTLGRPECIYNCIFLIKCLVNKYLFVGYQIQIWFPNKIFSVDRYSESAYSSQFPTKIQSDPGKPRDTPDFIWILLGFLSTPNPNFRGQTVKCVLVVVIVIRKFSICCYDGSGKTSPTTYAFRRWNAHLHHLDICLKV